MKKREFFRQCDLGVAEMIEAYKADNSVYPRCLFLNELGVIAYDESATNDGKEAQNFLASILVNQEPLHHQAIAFCYLSYVNELNGLHSEILEKFAQEIGAENMLKINKMVSKSS